MDINWQPQLENQTVKLLPLTESDFEELCTVASDPLIWEQHPASDRYKREVFRVFFDEAVLTRSAFVIIYKATGEIIGSTRFYNYAPADSAIAVGYTFLARKFWGGEVNGTVKKLMLDYTFQFVNTVTFHIGNTNARSKKAMEKIGGIRMKELQSDNNGQPSIHLEYHITKENWQDSVK